MKQKTLRIYPKLIIKIDSEYDYVFGLAMSSEFDRFDMHIRERIWRCDRVNMRLGKGKLLL